MRDEHACNELKNRFDDYLDGVLPPVARQAVELHLRTCSSCAREMQHRRCTRRLLLRLPREPMPDRLKERLLSAQQSRSDDPPPHADLDLPHATHDHPIPDDDHS